MTWQTTYPSLATVMQASFETLDTWREKLPPPQTDVEHTVLRRLKARHHELLSAKVKETAPEIASRLNDIIDRMERMGIKSPMAKL